MTEYQPKFFYKNQISDIAEISDTASTSDRNIRALIDRNDNVRYASIGETSADNDTVITWTPSAATYISNIVLLNHNFKAFRITYDSGTEFSTPIVVSGNSDTNHFFEFDRVQVNTVELTVSQTMTLNDIRQIGQIMMLDQIFEMDTDYTRNITPVAGGRSILQETSDGTAYKVFIRSAVGYDCVMEAVDIEERENYRAVYNTNKKNAFVFVRKPRDIYGRQALQEYLVDSNGDYLIDSGGDKLNRTADEQVWEGLAGHYHWANTWDFDNWVSDLEENGYVGNIQLVQAGGIS